MIDEVLIRKKAAKKGDGVGPNHAGRAPGGPWYGERSRPRTGNRTRLCSLRREYVVNWNRCASPRREREKTRETSSPRPEDQSK